MMFQLYIVYNMIMIIIPIIYYYYYYYYSYYYYYKYYYYYYYYYMYVYIYNIFFSEQVCAMVKSGEYLLSMFRICCCATKFERRIKKGPCGGHQTSTRPGFRGHENMGNRGWKYGGTTGKAWIFLGGQPWIVTDLPTQSGHEAVIGLEIPTSDLIQVTWSGNMRNPTFWNQQIPPVWWEYAEHHWRSRILQTSMTRYQTWCCMVLLSMIVNIQNDICMALWNSVHKISMSAWLCRAAPNGDITSPSLLKWPAMNGCWIPIGTEPINHIKTVFYIPFCIICIEDGIYITMTYIWSIYIYIHTMTWHNITSQNMT